MQSHSTVEIADRHSRRRAAFFAVAALAFLIIHVALRPFSYAGGGDAVPPGRIDWWAVNALVLMAVLVTGGGLLNRREVRALVNDEVSRSNYRASVVAAYWIAMVSSMVLYFVPSFAAFSAREAVYVIVTSSVGLALLVFSYLEYRAHQDA